jgi:CubicO group peptidase (beta-lactamase class C family)
MKEINELLEKFKNRMEKRKVRLHGAVLMQGKKVIGEVYNFPYSKETKTRLYSTSKSIASVAIGKLVKEGKLSLDEKIVDIFADKFDTSSCHPYLKEQTVKDMLKMTTVYSRSTYWVKDKNWLETYFGAVEPTHPCGTVWYYDSSGSYVLGAIVKHRTGKDFVEYLRPEFDEIGVSSGVYCFEGPDGEAWASSAVVATTSDLAKIAYLMLEKGEWNGKQLIDREYQYLTISSLLIQASQQSKVYDKIKKNNLELSPLTAPAVEISE